MGGTAIVRTETPADGLLPAGGNAPGFILKDTGKKPLNLGDLTRRNVVLVSFFILGSGFSQLQLGELQKLQDRRSPGLAIVCIGVGARDSEDQIRRYWETNKLTLPVARNGAGPNDVYRLYHVSSVPTVYLVSKDGKIVARWAGFPKKTGPARLKSELAKAGVE